MVVLLGGGAHGHFDQTLPRAFVGIKIGQMEAGFAWEEHSVPVQPIPVQMDAKRDTSKPANVVVLESDIWHLA